MRGNWESKTQCRVVHLVGDAIYVEHESLLRIIRHEWIGELPEPGDEVMVVMVHDLFTTESHIKKAWPIKKTKINWKKEGF